MTPCFSGTLKSTRTKTRRPFSARSRIVRFAMDRRSASEAARGHLAQQIYAAARVTPFVVVPRQNLDEITVHDLRIRGIDDRRIRIAAEVDGDKRLVRHAQDVLQRARRGLA